MHAWAARAVQANAKSRGDSVTTKPFAKRLSMRAKRNTALPASQAHTARFVRWSSTTFGGGKDVAIAIPWQTTCCIPLAVV